MEPEFPQFMRRLREQRGLSQNELASRSGVTTSTLSRWERYGLGSARRSNIRAVFQTLDQLSPLSREDADAFCKFTGLDRLVAVAKRAAQLSHDPASHHPPGLSGDGLSAEEAQCYSWLAALLNHLDPKRVLASLEATAAVAGVPTPEEPRLDRTQIALRVAHPPQRLPDGAIEQRFTYYTADGRELTPIPAGPPGARRAQ